MSPLVSIAPGAYLFLAVLLLTLPLPWLAAGLTAACFHECCHWAAVRGCGGQITHLEADMGGLVMEIAPLSLGRELLCALAGPLGSFLLLLLLPWFPRLALCGLAQGLFNLLPLFPFDGGRILRCAAQLLLHRAAVEPFCRWAGGIVLLLLVCLGFYLHLGVFSILLPLSLWLRAKIPCKTGPGRIQ